MNIGLFHSLQGQNIYFKSLSVDDVQEIHRYASDPDVKRFIGWKLMETLEQTREYIEKMLKREEEGSFIYASIVLKSTGGVIGTAMIFGFDHEAKHAEIGYVFHRDYWGKGYGTEAVRMMDNFAFETLNLHKLHGRVASSNIGSARVLEKNGYEIEGRLKDYYFIDDKYHDNLFFGKIK
jgi:[ribosomal protein S5]-alanine N-acetyltransferase